MTWDIIQFENLRDFAYANLELCKAPIRAVAVEFYGLGNTTMQTEHTPRGRLLAEAGVLYVVPYLNPWAWMNRTAAETTNRIIDVLCGALRLPDDVPLVSTGGSMGGLSAIAYMLRARRVPAACVANCPVCDLPYHLTERPDLPRTLLSAFGDSGAASLQEALEAASPLHLADQLPSARYTVFHCEEDLAVNKAAHSDRFVEVLRRRFPVDYISVPGRGHCDLTDEALLLYHEAIIRAK